MFGHFSIRYNGIFVLTGIKIFRQVYVLRASCTISDQAQVETIHRVKRDNALFKCESSAKPSLFAGLKVFFLNCGSVDLALNHQL